MTFDVFAFIHNLIALPIIAAANAIAAALSAAVEPVLRWGLVVLLAATLLARAIRPAGGDPIGDTIVLLVKGAVALYVMVSMAGYALWARDVLLLGLPQDASRIVAGALGGGELNVSAFQAAWLRSYDLGLGVYNGLPSTLAAMPLYAVVWVYWVISFAAVAFAFGVWEQAFVGVALLFAIGPLFAGLWLLAWTRGWFHGWLNTTVAHVVLQVLVVGLLALLLGTTGRMLAEIAAATGVPAPPAAAPTPGSILRQYRPGSAAQMAGPNEMLQVAGLFGAALVYGLLGFMAYRLNGYANSIAHGFSLATGSAMKSMQSWGASALGGARGAAGAVVASAAGQASPGFVHARVAPAPGPSLSNRP